MLWGSALPAAAAGEIAIEKLVNDATADAAPGPTVNAGAKVTFTYRITVNHPDGLYDIQVLDSSGAVPNCDTNGDGRPDGSNVHQGPVGGGDTFICTASQTAGSAGTSASSAGIARGSDFFGTAKFESSDPGHFTVRRPTTTVGTTTAPATTTAPTTVRPTTTQSTARSADTAAKAATADLASENLASENLESTQANDGETDDETAATDGNSNAGEGGEERPVELGIVVESMVNGNDADTAPGPQFDQGETVRWTHLVVNTGQTTLRDVTVTDSVESDTRCRLDGQVDDLGNIAMPTVLSPGQSILCESDLPASTSSDPAAVVALVTVKAQAGSDRSTTFTVSDPVHYSIMASDGDSDVPGELAFTEESSDESPSTLNVPWALVPGLIALVAGAFFLLGLVRRPQDI